jgi:uncharacterized protein HemY
MDPALVRMTKWLSDVLTLQTWWHQLAPDTRNLPATLEAATKRVQPLFPADDPDEAKKTVKLQEVLTKQQLVTLVDCLARVSGYQQR